MSTDGFEFITPQTHTITVNKFGRATNCDNGVKTDVWDGANASDDVDIWVAPTASRIHAIVSDDANDTSAGTGAKTIRVYGLREWDGVESSEVITMAGTTPVNTVRSYVIIHRMEVLTKGASGPNVGKITATTVGQGANTVTAYILALEGQTQMAIYGVGSRHDAYMTNYYASAIKGNTGTTVGVSLLVNPEPQTELIGFLVKHTQGLAEDGSTHINHQYNPYFKIPGPCIIKMQVNSDTINTDCSAGFDLILKEKSEGLL